MPATRAQLAAEIRKTNPQFKDLSDIESEAYVGAQDPRYREIFERARGVLAPTTQEYAANLPASVAGTPRDPTRLEDNSPGEVFQERLLKSMPTPGAGMIKGVLGPGAPTSVDQAVQDIPPVAMAVGGIAGTALGGPAGAVGLAGLSGAGGEKLRQMIQRARGKENLTPEEADWELRKATLMGAGGEFGGQAIGKAFDVSAPALYRFASRAGNTLRLRREFPQAVQDALDRGIALSDRGAARTAATTQAGTAQADAMITAAKKAGAKPLGLVEDILNPTVAEVGPKANIDAGAGNPQTRAALIKRVEDIQAEHALPPSRPTLVPVAPDVPPVDFFGTPLPPPRMTPRSPGPAVDPIATFLGEQELAGGSLGTQRMAEQPPLQVMDITPDATGAAPFEPKIAPGQKRPPKLQFRERDLGQLPPDQRPIFDPEYSDKPETITREPGTPDPNIQIPSPTLRRWFKPDPIIRKPPPVDYFASESIPPGEVSVPPPMPAAPLHTPLASPVSTPPVVGPDKLFKDVDLEVAQATKKRLQNSLNAAWRAQEGGSVIDSAKTEIEEALERAHRLGLENRVSGLGDVNKATQRDIGVQRLVEGTLERGGGMTGHVITGVTGTAAAGGIPLIATGHVLPGLAMMGTAAATKAATSPYLLSRIAIGLNRTSSPVMQANAYRIMAEAIRQQLEQENAKQQTPDTQ